MPLILKGLTLGLVFAILTVLMMLMMFQAQLLKAVPEQLIIKLSVKLDYQNVKMLQAQLTISAAELYAIYQQGIQLIIMILLMQNQIHRPQKSLAGHHTRLVLYRFRLIINQQQTELNQKKPTTTIQRKTTKIIIIWIQTKKLIRL